MASPLDRVLQAGNDTLGVTTAGPRGVDVAGLAQNSRASLAGFSQPQISVADRSTINVSSGFFPTVTDTTPVPTPAPKVTTSFAAPVGAQEAPQGGGAEERATANRDFDVSSIKGIGRAQGTLNETARGLIGAVPGFVGLAAGVGALQEAGVPSVNTGSINPSNLSRRNRAAFERKVREEIEVSKTKISKTPTPSVIGKTLNKVGVGRGQESVGTQLGRIGNQRNQRSRNDRERGSFGSNEDRSAASDRAERAGA